MTTMEQALRDHGLIVLQVEDVERLLGKWQHEADLLGREKMSDHWGLSAASRFGALSDCLQDLQRLVKQD